MKAWPMLTVLLALGCVATGGGMGGSPDPAEADVGCDPRPGEYTASWSLDVAASDDECPAIEPSSSRFDGADESDCASDCTCTRSITEDDGVCVGLLAEECVDGPVVINLACALAVAGGDTSFDARCGVEIVEGDETLLDCRYDVVYRRTGD